MDATAPVPAGSVRTHPGSDAGSVRSGAAPAPRAADARTRTVAGRRAPGPRSVAVVDAHADLAALAGAWDDLWSRTPSATPFQTHAWLTSWAQAYVPAGDLVVVVVRDGDVLVAGAALHRVRRGPARVLVPLGGDLSDHCDVLLDPRAPDAGDDLVAALLAVPGWTVVDLPEVSPTASAQAWSLTWPGRVDRSPASRVLTLPAVPVDEALARVPSRTASTLRRKLRKIDRLDVRVNEVLPADVPRAVTDLIALHEAQWAGRLGNPEHLTARFRKHLVGALVPMVEREQAVVVEYRRDGALVASEVDLLGHGQLAYYLAGIDPGLREDIDTAVLLVRSALDRAVRLGLPEYSFLRGDEDYKFRWRPDEVRATRLLLARPGRPGALVYLAAAASGRAVMTTARRLLTGRPRLVARAIMQAVRTLRARA